MIMPKSKFRRPLKLVAPGPVDYVCAAVAEDEL
jgi:hypothetical protein